MSLQDSLFSEDVEHDVTTFSRDQRRKRVLVFPPVNNYRRYIIHQLVQDRFSELLHTFSIGQGADRRTVVCYKTDVIRDPKLNGAESKASPAATRASDSFCGMGVEGRRSPSASPERARLQRQAKSVPAVEIYRPPAARRNKNELRTSREQIQPRPNADAITNVRNSRQRRPDRAVYVPRHRRSLEHEASSQDTTAEACRTSRAIRDDVGSSSAYHEGSKLNSDDTCSKEQDTSNVPGDVNNSTRESSSLGDAEIHSSNSNLIYEVYEIDRISAEDTNTMDLEKSSIDVYDVDVSESVIDQPSKTDDRVLNLSRVEEHHATREEQLEHDEIQDVQVIPLKETVNLVDCVSTLSEQQICEVKTPANEIDSESIDDTIRISNNNHSLEDSNKCWDGVIMLSPTKEHKLEEKFVHHNEIENNKNRHSAQYNRVSDVLVISDNIHEEEKKAKEIPIVPMTPPEKKVKKIERQKSKPVPPPAPPLKINRDECDWDSLFDDNGDCLDPSLIEELTSAVGDVMIERPKNDYKMYSKQIEVSSDEFAHVVEIYNFPSDFKTSDLAVVFSPFKNGGFELKWVDDTHCLGVFSSPLIAAEVLASEHPFVKTRPLSEATALSKTKARRSAEFLQPYRSRPETCAALARRLVTGALGVKLATARQEREHEKNVLREAKEKRRLANKQREDAWEGIIPQK